MKVSDAPVESPAERYGRRQLHHALEMLQTDNTHAAVCRAVAVLIGYTRTLRRGAGRQLELTLPGAVRDDFGWEPGTHVTLWRTPAGSLELRTARDEDFPRDIRVALEAVDQAPANLEPKAKLRHYERICKQCGDLFCARSPNVRYCRLCAWRRRRASDRLWWARAGKQSPSYQRKVRPRTPAEEIPTSAVA
jgi:hypothetical protein